MKLILLLLSSLMFNFSFSQKCKYEVNKIDEFTKEKILETRKEMFGKSVDYLAKNYVETWFSSKDNQKYIGFYFHLTPVFSVNSSSKIILLTSDGSTYDIPINQTEISKSYYSSFVKMYFHYMNLPLPLTEEIDEVIKTKKIEKIRFHTSSGYLDFTVKDKDFKKISELIKCI